MKIRGLLLLSICLFFGFSGCGISSDETTGKTGDLLQKNALESINDDMAYMQDGVFADGCKDAPGPHPTIAVRNFYISRFEVSQGEYEAIMDTNPSLTKCPTCPVNNISFADAQKFIARLNMITGKNYRLPTDAEWKYMKRGGRKSLGYKYSGFMQVRFDSTSPTIHYVNQSDSNEAGIYDLDSTDVWEYCNASAPGGKIVVMRSAYSIRQDEASRWCCIAYSSLVSPGRREYSLGLRLARN